jgi:hypothetical protein
MIFIRLIFLIGIVLIAYWAIRKLTKPSSPVTPDLLKPNKNDIDISIEDNGEDGLPVITVMSNGATLNIRSLSRKRDNILYRLTSKLIMSL